LGKEQFGEKAGTIAGWAWAMAPPLLFIPWLLWETCLSALVLTFGLMNDAEAGGGFSGGRLGLVRRGLEFCGAAESGDSCSAGGAGGRRRCP
jgi:hypothetical protein